MLTKLSDSNKIVPDAASLTLLFTSLYYHSLRDYLLELDTEAEYKEVVEFFGGSISKEVPSSYPHDVAPDICANCFKLIGGTVGGRVRCGCYGCKGCENKKRIAVTFFSTLSGLSPEEAVFELSKILYSIKEIEGR